MSKNRKGYQEGSLKNKHFAGNAETMKFNKKPYALRKIYWGVRLFAAGVFDLLKGAKQ